MIRFLLAILLLSLSSCQLFNQEQKPESVARVGKSYLYKSDIADLLPEGTTKEDSLVIVQNFINRWATQKLLINAAELNITKEEQIAFDELIQQYKVDLYTKAYLEDLVSLCEKFKCCLIVDEAHRLNAKSGMFKNLGENQIKEIINSSKFSVFFIDENQKVAIHDIGEIDEIELWANEYNAEITKLELSSQFRCNGSDGYLAWLDYILQIRETANTFFDVEDYDFKVLDSPSELRDTIFEKNKSFE